MATCRISDFLNFMNNQAEMYEIFSETLSKAQALSFVLMKAPLDECPDNIIEYYLWALTDILTTLLNHNECHLKELLKTIREKHMTKGQGAG